MMIPYKIEINVIIHIYIYIFISAHRTKMCDTVDGTTRDNMLQSWGHHLCRMASQVESCSFDF